ncbi:MULTISPECIES: DUF4148 domain-containing protein [Burkholderia]|jgi:hypothetical protein|uniref:Purine nucleoside phosphorylase n=2 Tax=Burkholderia multivorans TaxID=87883 RepID=B9BM82_9BURK|nr:MULTISPECIES: DUF4148 domain-containing protein [Burkholderia]AVR22154.1 DUF4148 domain-containing protein [Burkholderia multivorans]EEE07742.1 conserved hypothetical protein [Burkholderia multivorans CGD2]EEE14320.1 conserved hypothetical protein [Burkholderia multivorans CGD2M]EJO57073.1 hypothetical protein BURMUCF1_1576 [Burkholderia multivorans ATCC BAA-247]KOE26442.1 hypothetical protein AI46_08355 [Burkholderia multivorans R-20526]
MMKTQLIAALLVAVSAAVAAPAFANESALTRAQVRTELVQLEAAGYAPGRANDPHYPADLEAALSRIHTNAPASVSASASAYGSDAAPVAQSGSRLATRVADRSIYFGH